MSIPEGPPFELRLNDEEDTVELWMFGEFVASWDPCVNPFTVIVPRAIKEAIDLGKKLKAAEIRKALMIIK